MRWLVAVNVGLVAFIIGGCAALAREVRAEPAATPTGTYQLTFVPDVIRPDGSKAALFACYAEAGDPGSLVCMDFKSFLDYAAQHSSSRGEHEL